jgi:hypothetical protein
MGHFQLSRVTNKNLVFDIGFLDNGQYSIELLRQQTYRFFPMNSQVTVEVKTENRTGVITGRVESNEPNIFSKNENTQISMICAPAYFMGKEVIETAFTSISSGFSFPFSNESLTLKLLKFSDININTEKNVFYMGYKYWGSYVYGHIRRCK